MLGWENESAVLGSDDQRLALTRPIVSRPVARVLTAFPVEVIGRRSVRPSVYAVVLGVDEANPGVFPFSSFGLRQQSRLSVDES